MKHAETFDRGVGLILQKLLEEHPVELRMDLNGLDPDGADKETVKVYRETMKFLIREGIVNGHLDAANAPIFAKVSLPLATMVFMGATPKSLAAPGKTWGERFGAAARAGAKESLAIVSREFLRYVGEQVGLPRRPEADQLL